MTNTRDNDRTCAPSSSPLIICQINISGLSQHSASALEQYIEEQKIDILAIQEIGAPSGGMHIFKNHITFMKVKQNECKGVAISIRKTLQHS